MTEAQEILLKFQVIGVFAALIISIISLVVNLIANKKSGYIKEITTLKAKYIDNLRLVVAEFASVAFECNRVFVKASSGDKDQLIKEVNFKYAHALLFLNNANPIDAELSRLLLKIKIASASAGLDGMAIGATITELCEYTQKVLLFEWRNLKHEAKHGPMDDREIQARRDEFMKPYV